MVSQPYSVDGRDKANLSFGSHYRKDGGETATVTVSFDLSDTLTQNRLKDCSSDNLEKKVAAGEPTPKYYFNTNTNEELASAFGIIRDSLARNMFLSK